MQAPHRTEELLHCSTWRMAAQEGIGCPSGSLQESLDDLRRAMRGGVLYDLVQAIGPVRCLPTETSSNEEWVDFCNRVCNLLENRIPLLTEYGPVDGYLVQDPMKILETSLPASQCTALRQFTQKGINPILNGLDWGQKPSHVDKCNWNPAKRRQLTSALAQIFGDARPAHATNPDYLVTYHQDKAPLLWGMSAYQKECRRWADGWQDLDVVAAQECKLAAHIRGMASRYLERLSHDFQMRTRSLKLSIDCLRKHRSDLAQRIGRKGHKQNTLQAESMQTHHLGGPHTRIQEGSAREARQSDGTTDAGVLKVGGVAHPIVLAAHWFVQLCPNQVDTSAQLEVLWGG
jgi:hypothetical protein